MLLKKITCNFFVADLVVLASNLSSRIALIRVAIWRLSSIVLSLAFVASQNLGGQILFFAESDREQSGQRSQKNQIFHGAVILMMTTLKLTSLLANFITGNISQSWTNAYLSSIYQELTNDTIWENFKKVSFSKKMRNLPLKWTNSTFFCCCCKHFGQTEKMQWCEGCVNFLITIRRNRHKCEF